jgi:Ca2+-binding EF-hand superfamily protein
LSKLARAHFLTLRTCNCFLNDTYSEILKLKECFSSLDKDGSGAIGIEELEDPLIGLGFADNTSQV